MRAPFFHPFCISLITKFTIADRVMSICVTWTLNRRFSGNANCRHLLIQSVIALDPNYIGLKSPFIGPVGFMMTAPEGFQASLHKPILLTHPGSFQVIQARHSFFRILDAPGKGQCLQSHFSIFWPGAVYKRAQMPGTPFKPEQLGIVPPPEPAACLFRYFVEIRYTHNKRGGLIINKCDKYAFG